MLSSQEKLLLDTLCKQNIISLQQKEECITLFNNSPVKPNLFNLLVAKQYVSQQQLTAMIQNLRKSVFICSKCQEAYLISDVSQRNCAKCGGVLLSPTQTQQMRMMKPRKNRDELDIGDSIASYKIVKELGRGGMGIVYEVIDSTTNDRYALKLMSPLLAGGQSHFKRFQREAKALARLQHPGIVKMKEVSVEREKYFLVMDFIPGKTLDTYMDKALEWRAALIIIYKLAKALEYAHSQGVVHRDLKPQNIIISNFEPVIMDFGLTKILDAKTFFTATGKVLGTPRYMSPEQADGRTELDHRSDLYTLGVILYDLITGQPMIAHKQPSKIIDAVINEMPVAPNQVIPDIPPMASSICMKALAKDPDNRFQSGEQLAKVIEDFLDGATSLQSFPLFSDSSTGIPQDSVIINADNLTMDGDNFSVDSSEEVSSMPKTAMLEQQQRSKSDLLSQGNFKHYEILSELGRGGMGIVYQALDRNLKRKVALKVVIKDITNDDTQFKRFIKEAQATARLRHPNIVELYEVGEEPQPYFTMEFVQGDSLSGVIKKKGVSPIEAAKIIAKCADALSVAHRNKIIHRDIKPSNIMMANGKEPKIMDFGLAKEVGDKEGLSKEGDMLGTPAYMPPEQADNKEVDGRSDIYSLGAALYETLTGRAPFQGDSYYRILAQIFKEDPVAPRKLNPDIPIDLEAICMKCMEKKPEHRYQNARILTKDLQNFLENKPVIAKPATKLTHVRKWISRNKLLASVSISSFLVIVIGVAIAFWAINAEKNIANFEKNVAIEERKKANEAKEAEEKARLQAQQANKDLETANSQLVSVNAKLGQVNNELESINYSTNIQLANKFLQDNSLEQAQKILAQCSNENLRGWEWHWLRNKGHLENRTLYQAQAKISPIDIHPENDSIAFLEINFLERSIEVVNLQGNRKDIIGKIPAKNYNNGGVNFSADGKFLLTWAVEVADYSTASEKWTNYVYLWNLQSKKLQRAFEYNYNNLALCSCCFSYDGTKIAAGLSSPSTEKYIGAANFQKQKAANNLIIWDVATGKSDGLIANEHSSNEYYVRSIQNCLFTKDNKTVITAGGLLEDGLISAWDITNKTKKLSLKGHHLPTKKSYLFLALNKTGNILASVSYNELYLWNLKNPKKFYAMPNNRVVILCCSFSPDSKIIATGGVDNNITLWNVQNRQKLTVLTGHLDDVISCQFTQDGKHLISASADGKIKLWNLSDHVASDLSIRTKKPLILPKPKHYPIYLDFDNSGKRISVSYKHGIQADIWDLTKGYAPPVVSIIHTGVVAPQCSPFSPDGTKILSSSGDGQLRLWDAFTGELLVHFEGHALNKSMRNCAFNSQGNFVLSGSEGGTMRMWNAEFYSHHKKGEQRQHLVKFVMPANTSRDVRFCTFSPDDKYAISTCQDGIIRFWNADPQKTPREETVPVHSLAMPNPGYSVDFAMFTPDGKYFAATNDRELVVWNTETWEIYSRISEPIGCFAFYPQNEQLWSQAPEKRRIITSNSRNAEYTMDIYKFAQEVKQPVFTIEYPTPIEFLTVSDGKVVLGMRDKSILVYDAAAVD